MEFPRPVHLYGRKHSSILHINLYKVCRYYPIRLYLN